MKIEKVFFKKELRLALYITERQMLQVEIVRKINGSLWHQEEGIWTIPYQGTTFSLLKELFTESLEIIHPEDNHPRKLSVSEQKMPQPSYVSVR